MASTMSRQDFELIARVIRELPQHPDHPGLIYREHLAVWFSDALAETNPRFDHDRFIAACAKAKT